MGNKNDTKKTAAKVMNGISTVTNGLSAAASILTNAKPALDSVKEYTEKAIEKRKNLIIVPSLYLKEYPLNTDQAERELEKHKLESTLIKLTLNEANVKYRNCFENQVIKTHPKAKQKVEQGSIIKVKYITQEVIEESIRLFNEQEEKKKQEAADKAIKRSERKEKRQLMITTAVESTRKTVNKIPLALKNLKRKTK